MTKKKIQITKIRYERMDITTDLTELKRITTMNNYMSTIR